MTLDPIEAWWAEARAAHPHLPAAVPDAWAFGAGPEQADELLALVLDEVKTATASSLRDYGAEDEPMPRPGDLGIVLDGAGRPRAVLETTDVRVVPFGEVTAEHADAEGEGDRSLTSWRREHERFWREHSTDPRGFTENMPVVCERFRVLYAPATES